MKNYNPYFVESISKADEDNYYYILDVIPPNLKIVEDRSNDFFYELHLKTLGNPLLYQDYIQNYIHIEHLDSKTIEIYEGETYEESCSNGPIQFEVLELLKFEKPFKKEYQSKLFQLQLDYTNLFENNLEKYTVIRNEILKHFQAIYDNSTFQLDNFDLSIEEVSKLYLLHHNSSAYDLNTFLDSNYSQPKQSKCWKIDYENLLEKYEKLKNNDFFNFDVILEHQIEIIQNKYNLILTDLAFNHKNLEQQKYHNYFEYLMNQLKKIEL